MKKVLAAAALAATMIGGSALPSFAAVPATTTTNFGQLTDGSVATLASGRNLNGLSFTDTYTFSLASSFLASVSVTATTVKGLIENFTLKLYEPDGTVLNASAGSANTGSTVNFDSLSLGVGDYKLVVTGYGASLGKGTVDSYGGSLNISAVPLPGTVGLFGAAIFGLGAAGMIRKRRQAAAAA